MRVRWLLAAAVALCAACGEPPRPRGQFGPYAEHNMVLRLANGDTFTVYRVKHLRFQSGEPPALQLEFAAHAPTGDTLALRREVRTLWPSYAPYLEAAGVHSAIVTATRLRVRRRGFAWTSRADSYGFTARRGPDGSWYLSGPPGPPLPPADPGAPPILKPDGQPFPPAQLRDQLTRLLDPGSVPAAR